MKYFFILLIIPFCLSFYGCIEKEQITATVLIKKDSILIDTVAIEPDTNQYLYDFIRMVEKDQKLDYGYGLSFNVEPTLHLDDDESFLLKFIKTAPQKHVYYSTPPHNTDSGQTGYKADSSFSLKISEPFVLNPIDLFPNNECLTKGDIKYMLTEKTRLQKFSWNNQKLGFNLANKNNWYTFSLPYFSKDKQTAFISIRELCPGLCGSGYVLLYKFENNKWTSTRVDTWWH